MDKNHVIHIIPVPPEIIAFAPLDVIDTKYGQIYKISMMRHIRLLE